MFCCVSSERMNNDAENRTVLIDSSVESTMFAVLIIVIMMQLRECTNEQCMHYPLASCREGSLYLSPV